MIKYVLLFIFSVLWIVGCHPTLRHTAFEWGLAADSYRYGDLYHLANLPQFKKRVEICPKTYTNKHHSNNNALYIIGDSFTEKERINADDFNSREFLRIHWNDSLTVHLDTTKRNVLLLETVERHFREHFAVSVRQFTVHSPQSTVHSPQPIADSRQPSAVSRQPIADNRPPIADNRPPIAVSQIAKTWTEILKESEESLTYFLFYYDFFLFFKELKASLNLRWFDRHSDQVAITPDGKNILYRWDTDSIRITSCFKYLSDKELNSLVVGVNKARDFYLAQGFDAVYLSIIPNKTSVVAPEMGNYNHLIERVQQHPQLKTPFIDVLAAYTQHPQGVYSLSDTHWNCTGQGIWLEAVNQRLR